MFNTGYPTTNIELKDSSGARNKTLQTAPEEGLHIPFSFIMAERGAPGEIYYGASAELTPIFGESTFDTDSPYFNQSTFYVAQTMARQGCEVMRLVDPAAKTAALGLFVSVTHKNITQYKKDASGARLLNSNGDYIPKVAADGTTIVTEPGVSVTWSIRPLTSSESYDALVTKSVTNAGVTTVTYPVIGKEVTSPGKYGNRQGFKLFSSPAKGSTGAVGANTMLYRFVPVELPTDVSTTASVINDIYGSNYNDISFRDQARYAPANTNYAFRNVIDNLYVDPTSGVSLLPYDMKAYGDYIGTIGADVLALSPELGDIDPYMIDLIAGTDLDGNLLDHLEITDASYQVVNAVATNYAVGGSDGDTSWTMFESLVQDWLTGDDHGEFINLQQHPMTHFYDPGFSVPTKYLLFNMLDLRDNIKIDVVTQDVSLAPNTKAQDIAIGQALLFRAQIHPQSILNGVGCMRVGIYAHAGQLVYGSGYDKLVAFNLNRLLQRCELQGGTYVKGSAGGLDNSEVKIFRKPNWVADDKVSQAVSWANCINTVRHATRTRIFYPSFRTVYPNDTSLLSDDEVSDYVVFIYKICRFTYSVYAGKKTPPVELYPTIAKDIIATCDRAFSGDDIKIDAVLTQTAQDANLGTQATASISVTGSNPLRTLNFNVDIGRTVTA